MTPELEQLLKDLEEYGESHDAATTDHGARMLNITRDTGVFLSMLIRLQRPARILEVGTSNGYSTIWLAHAAASYGGRVDTIERSAAKQELAAANFAKAAVAGHVAQLNGEAGALLAAAPSRAYGFVFLDSKRTDYASWWSD